MNELLDRLREACIDVSGDYLEQVRTALSAIGDQASIKVGDALAMTRCCFPERATEADFATVGDLLRKRGVQSDVRARQLISSLAALALIERFGRGPGRRTAPKLLGDSVAALAVRGLVNGGHESIHPDVSAFATLWIDSVADQLRIVGALTQPPELPPDLASLATPPGEEGAPESLQGDWRVLAGSTARQNGTAAFPEGPILRARLNGRRGRAARAGWRRPRSSLT